MIWTPEQDHALRAVAKWIKNPAGRPVFRLFGFAGSGKSTISKQIADDTSGQVLFAAYTGKAAHVLRSKGCEGASTLHSLIYLPKGKCRERLAELESRLAAHNIGQVMLSPSELVEVESRIVEERVSLSKPAFSLNQDSPLRAAKLLIVDEVSMVGTDLAEDLLSFDVPILALGDPAQLPPVYGGGYFTDAAPDIMLTDIQRQAKDNPIIAMASAVREGRGLSLGTYGDSRVIARPDPEEIPLADQVLVGKNVTRHAYNKRMREVAGRKGLVEAGDKVICLRNDRESGLLNGGIWMVDGVGPGDDTLGIPTVALSLSDDETRVDCYAHTFAFEDQSNAIAMPYWERQVAQEFASAGAITVHKSQGSQFDHVVLVDESSSFRDAATRWLYTGITRAAKRITVVRPS